MALVATLVNCITKWRAFPDRRGDIEGGSLWLVLDTTPLSQKRFDQFPDRQCARWSGHLTGQEHPVEVIGERTTCR